MNRYQLPEKYVIGLTGNICAGKSEVCAVLVELGAHHVDADVVARQTLVRGTSEFVRVVAEFGEGILSKGGDIDRGRLGEIVFAEVAALSRLESIVLPAIRHEIKRRVSVAEQPVVVLEAIKLLDSGLSDDCDAIWVVAAAPEERLKRLIERDGLDEATALQRVNMQAGQEEKLNLADVVIDNNGRLQPMFVQVRRAWGKIMPPE